MLHQSAVTPAGRVVGPHVGVAECPPALLLSGAGVLFVDRQIADPLQPSPQRVYRRDRAAAGRAVNQLTTERRRHGNRRRLWRRRALALHQRLIPKHLARLSVSLDEPHDLLRLGKDIQPPVDDHRRAEEPRPRRRPVRVVAVDPPAELA